MWKIVTTIHDKREFAKFLEETKQTRFGAPTLSIFPRASSVGMAMNTSRSKLPRRSQSSFSGRLVSPSTSTCLSLCFVLRPVSGEVGSGEGMRQELRTVFEMRQEKNHRTHGDSVAACSNTSVMRSSLSPDTPPTSSVAVTRTTGASDAWPNVVLPLPEGPVTRADLMRGCSTPGHRKFPAKSQIC
ncbi:hypothetical protein E2C01_046076 [Portunus trituberculatus]|uniref:Integrin beta subunit cytoplasmic domain-containing protein n=1 Tax=Portunus trituberculatus TaxID=210409 RepID=A0A5B7G4L8_PORTR|nr:hypothetical protein [Portunus trituberculatus]